MKREWLKRLTALVLCLLMMASLAACGSDSDGETSDPDTPPVTSNPSDGANEPDEPAFVVADTDEDIYFNAYGEFYEAYQKAMEASTVSERHALLAVAEAKALEAAGGTPIYANAATWQMTRSVYRTGGYASWRGGMTDYSQAVLTNEIITAEDHLYLTALWKELMGTGTYAEKAVEYLTEKGYTFDDSYDRVFTVVPTT